MDFGGPILIRYRNAGGIAGISGILETVAPKAGDAGWRGVCSLRSGWLRRWAQAGYYRTFRIDAGTALLVVAVLLEVGTTYSSGLHQRTWRQRNGLSRLSPRAPPLIASGVL
jgi:hypothetical protein